MSGKNSGNLAALMTWKKHLQHEIEKFGLEFYHQEIVGMVACIHIESSLISKIKEARNNDDEELWSIIENVKAGKQPEF